MTRASTFGLATGAVRGDRLVHLFEARGERSLCSRPARSAPGSGFRSAPCGGCLASALERGHTVARDGGNAYVNLRRLASAALSA